MFEKVNPSHPDKVADRIAGAIIDRANQLAESTQRQPRCAVEVLIGHGRTFITMETTSSITKEDILPIVGRIAGTQEVHCVIVPQDEHLSENQQHGLRCGDNGIFKGTPITGEQDALTHLARLLYRQIPSDGKYLIDRGDITICQSNAMEQELIDIIEESRFRYDSLTVNPLGYWKGGPDVDSGATNRKLGSDMGDGVTGGGLHGKDLSKADVSVNIWCHLKAQQKQRPIHAICNIGDETVKTSLGPVPFTEMVRVAQEYITSLGGYEKFAEWGLVRPFEIKEINNL